MPPAGITSETTAGQAAARARHAGQSAALWDSLRVDHPIVECSASDGAQPSSLTTCPNGEVLAVSDRRVVWFADSDNRSSRLVEKVDPADACP